MRKLPNGGVLRRFPREGETYTRIVLTDEECQRLLQHRTKWSYVLRDDTGDPCAWGRGTKAHCEKIAVKNATEWAEERSWCDETVSITLRADHWRVRFWPPTQPRRRR